MIGDLDAVLADPVRLLSGDRSALRNLLSHDDRACGVGPEVFLQAEAIFGGADVTPAEFASWLHFAAKAIGHDAYAARIAGAGPGMPWRTVWAWWRPAHWFLAHPSLNGDYFRVRRCVDGDRELVEVTDQRGRLWLDAETGHRATVVDEAALTDAPAATQAAEAPALYDLDLFLPEEWQGVVAFVTNGGRTRHLVESVHGIAVVETDADALRNWRSTATATPAGTPVRWRAARKT
ncbi:hypothetical protein ACWERI_12430 [Streptomyces collinus]